MNTHSQAVTMLDWAGKPETIVEAGWTLVSRYEGDEKGAPAGLIDLSHRPKSLVYGPSAEDLGRLSPGQAVWNGRAYVCCRKPGERTVFDLAGPIQPHWPDKYYTDLTDAWVLFALIGPKAVEVMRRMIALDLERPDWTGPFFAVTRSHGMWVQMLNPKAADPGFFLACDRSHGRNLAHGLIHVGGHLGLKPMGLKAFDSWLEKNGLRS